MSRRFPREVALAIAIWSCRLIVAAVFVAAAVPKIEDPDLFLLDVSNYQVFPHWSWAFIAVTVPMMELVGSAAIVSGWKRRAGVLLLAALNAGFLALILSVIVRDIDISCGCFGYSPDAPSIGWTDVWRDVALMVGIVAAGMRTPGERVRDQA